MNTTFHNNMVFEDIRKLDGNDFIMNNVPIWESIEKLTDEEILKLMEVEWPNDSENEIEMGLEEIMIERTTLRFKNLIDSQPEEFRMKLKDFVFANPDTSWDVIRNALEM